jgi:three-Cys-motif partner protein
VSTRDFHSKQFSEGTKVKLDLIQLYAREWLPVFLAALQPKWKHVHIYDFFCGPGEDSAGVEGSPVRIVQELLACKGDWAAKGITVHLHFYDADVDKRIALANKLTPLLQGVNNVVRDIQTIPFDQAFPAALPTLNDPNAAKLVLLDPCGVNFVTPNVFKLLIAAKYTDFLFFLASSYLNRFREVDSIVLKIDRPNDFYHVHRVALQAFKSLVPANTKYYLAPFSIKKLTNIYGIIFGTSNLLGMDKFLSTAWNMAPSNGEANYDIDRADFATANPFLPMEGFSSAPTKLQAFESDLRTAILAGKCPTEREIIEVCFGHGARRQHSEAVIKALKAEKAVACDFRVPQIETLRPVNLLSGAG